MTGSVRLYSDSGEASIPISDYLAEHAVNITFTHLLDQAPEILMIVGSGIHNLEFRSVTSRPRRWRTSQACSDPPA